MRRRPRARSRSTEIVNLLNINHLRRSEPIELTGRLLTQTATELLETLARQIVPLSRGRMGQERWLQRSLAATAVAALLLIASYLAGWLARRRDVDMVWLGVHG